MINASVPPVPGTAAGGGAGGERGGPPGDGPPSGDGRDWYRNPRVIAAIGAGALTLGILAGWLFLGGDDGDDTAATTTTETTAVTSTTVPAPSTTATVAAPVSPTTTVEITDGTTAAPSQDPAGASAEQQALDAAVGRWAGVTGRSYVFAYSQDSEGFTFRKCVSGSAGDPASVADAAGACGDGVEAGGLGVEAWFDTIQDAILTGELVSASYDPTDGHPTAAIISFTAGDGISMTQDFLQFQ